VILALSICCTKRALLDVTYLVGITLFVFDMLPNQGPDTKVPPDGLTAAGRN
jgi:hypothetical protein